jgi:hypothetical protein
MAWIRVGLALMLLQVLSAPALGGTFPWKAGDAPPAVAGIRLGDGLVRLETVLGRPSSTEKLGKVIMVLTYQKRGLQVLYASLDGAAIIYLLSRTAGDIGGVRLGDKREDVLARWGDPPSVGGSMAIYKAGDWGVFVKLDEDDKVKQLGVGRITDKAPEGAEFYRKND